jgi:predicted Ser/Thr protein kinase
MPRGDAVVAALGLDFGFVHLLILVTVVALVVYVFSRGKRRQREPSQGTAFDPTAFREQLVQNIVRDAAGQPLASGEQIANSPNPRVPKGLIYGGVFGLIFLVVIVAVAAIAATHAITDPSVAKTAILSIVIGLVVLVLIIGVVIIAVAGIIWGGRPEALPEKAVANDLAKDRRQTPILAAAHPPGPRHCPACKATIPDDSPEGLCPKCLLGRCLKAPETPIVATGDKQTDSYAGPALAPPAVDLATRFPGLEILALLGQGGMGAVYKARQTKLDRLVAVKILPADWGKDPAFAERFAREAKALARLNHPHVVAVHDFGESEGLFYLVMEYVDGASLRHILDGGGLEAPEALAIIPQICDALQYAHEEGIVHRDIKPENILLDSKGRVKIADFGLAKLIDRPRAAFTLTGSQQVMGTLDYMAPEQRLTPQQVDHRADIYSLGVVFYEMLTGELPLGRFAPPSSKVGVDPRLDGIVFRALEGEPAQRYQRISEVKSDLQALTGAATPAIHPLPQGGILGQPIDRGVETRIRRLGILLLILAILGWASVPGWLVLAVEPTPQGNPLIWLGSIFVVLSVLISSLLSLSAWRAWQLKNYSLVVFATILAMLPWSIGFFFAVPIGYAILRTLADPAVSAAFASGRRGYRLRRDQTNRAGAETEVTGQVVCLPVKLGSLSEHRYPGMLRLEGDALVLEYMKGYVRAKIKEAVIQISHIRLVRLANGWFFDSLVLQTASLKSLEGIPNSAQGRLVLSISRKDRVAAERLVRAIQQKVPAVQIEGPLAQARGELDWTVDESPLPPPAPQKPGRVRGKLRSLFNSVYTMFFSRAKNAEPPTNSPAHEHSARQP